MKNARVTFIRATLIALAICCAAPELRATGPMIVVDDGGDAVIRRTDWANDGAIDPQIQRLPDLILFRLGRFLPDQPAMDPFAGKWSDTAMFLRFDLKFEGLVNPTGPLDLDDDDPEYDPMKYGPNPLCGYVEFDIDADENTGGELEYPSQRYLAQIGRFGGVPVGSQFSDRVAFDRGCDDHNVQTPPYIDRSGEEFHLVFRAEEIDYITVKSECAGGNPAHFEAGERWVLRGDFLHRAHGFEDYAFQCVDRPGRYKPEVYLQYSHDIAEDKTTVSLIYPLNNAACGQMENDAPEPNDGCEDNQNSITEALTDLRFSAINASPGDMGHPDFQLIAGWADNVVADCLDPTQWRVTCLLGTAYPVQQSGGDRFIWTDVWPNVVAGDFDGDGELNAADETLMESYVASVDGDPMYDDDATVNGTIQCNGFARYFMLFDVNYDGFVDENDLSDESMLGDMDLNNQVNIDDVFDFVSAILDPVQYAATHNGEEAVTRGDINGDGLLDARDIQGFTELLLQCTP